MKFRPARENRPGEINTLQQAVAQRVVSLVTPRDIIKIHIRDIAFSGSCDRVYPVRFPVQLCAARQPAHSFNQLLWLYAEATFKRMLQGKVDHGIVNTPPQPIKHVTFIASDAPNF